MQSRKTVIGVFLLVLCVSVGIAAAPTLTFKFRDVIAITTAQETDTYGINNTNAIAGDYVDSAGVQHGMILGGTNAFHSADRADCVSTPSSTSISFYGINSAGVAAGWCTNTSGVEIGYTYAKGTFTDIKIAGATLTNVNGINDTGAVVGTYIDSAGTQHGFLLVGGSLTTLDPPGVTGVATAWGINNAGVVTVFGTNSSGTYLSFTTADKGTTYTAFRAPGEGSLGTAIHEINNNGDIVGTYYDSSSNRHGWLYHAGNYYSFDDPNGVGSTRADGLNDMLVIVGRYGSGVYGGTGFEAFTTP